MYKIAFTGYKGDRVLCETDYISRGKAEIALKDLKAILPASIVRDCRLEIVDLEPTGRISVEVGNLSPRV